MRWRDFAVSLLFVYLWSLCFEFRFWLIIALLFILISCSHGSKTTLLSLSLLPPVALWPLKVADVGATYLSSLKCCLSHSHPMHAIVTNLWISWKKAQLFNLQWRKKSFLKPNTNLFDIWKKSRPRVWFVHVSLLCLKEKTIHLNHYFYLFFTFESGFGSHCCRNMTLGYKKVNKTFENCFFLTFPEYKICVKS